MWKVTIRGLLAHKLRLLLSALAVVLGIAFMSGTYVLTDSTQRGFDRLFESINAGIDFQVRTASPFGEGSGGPGIGDQRTPVEESILDDVRAVDGVADAEGLVFSFDVGVFLPREPGEDPELAGTFGPSIAVSVVEDEILSSYAVRDGRLPQRTGEVAIDKSTAKRHDFEIGGPVEVRGVVGDGERATREFELVGTIGLGDTDIAGGATVVMLTLDDAQELLDREGQFDWINVAIEAGESPGVVQDRIAAVLPFGVEVVPGAVVTEQQQNDVGQFLTLFQRILLVFGFIGVVVGGFVIVNTFTIIVSQRVRELALLRSLGASQAQVVGSVLLEALMVGLLASAVGLLGGVGLGWTIQRILGTVGFSPPDAGLVLLPRTIAVGMGVGTALTVISAVVPAVRASWVPPLAAVRRTEAGASRPNAVRSIVGAALLAVGLVIVVPMLGSERGGAWTRLAAGAGCVVVGMILVAPRFARPAAAAIGRPLAFGGRIHGVLARANSQRSARRTSSTASALMIGLSLVTVSLVLAASMSRSIRSIVESSFRSDINLATDFNPFPVALREQLEGEPEVGDTASWRFTDAARIAGSRRMFDGIDRSAIDNLVILDVREGSAAALDDDGVLLYERFAKDQGIRVGDVLPAEFERGPAMLRVEGIFYKKGFFDDIVTGLGTYERHVNQQRDFLVLLRAAPGVSVDRLREVAEAATAEEFPDVNVQDTQEFIQQQQDDANQFLYVVFALVAMAIFIAVLGVMNTLALSVFERTQEIGLLRAVGMSRRQVGKMIRGEAAIIAVFGALLGIVSGLLLGAALVVTLRSFLEAEIAVPWLQLAIVVVVAAIAGLAAALFPARRAAKLDVLEAIATE